jgi:hypothetical protein
MKKNILIPIDFKIDSLNTLKLAVQESGNDEIHAVLLYAGLLSNSFTDLLFYSTRDMIKSHVHPEFEQAISIIKNRFENNLKTFEIKTQHSNNIVSMRKFLTNNSIDEIYIPKSYRLETGANGFDPIPLLRESHYPLYEMDWKLQAHTQFKNQLDSIFNT